MKDTISPENWKKIEENVNEAEKVKRRSQKSSRDVYRDTAMTKQEREGKDMEKVTQRAKRKRVAENALMREENFAKMAEDILGEEGSPEHALAGLREKNLIAVLQEDFMLSKQREDLFREEAEIMAGIEGEASGAEQEALEEVRDALTELAQKREALLASSPEAYIGLHLKALKGYKKDLEKGKIAETPYVGEQMEDIVAHLRAGKPVLLYGHLGAGKTELAMHIAEKYYRKPALVVSGSKHMSQAELYGHQILTVEKIKKEDLDVFIREVGNNFNAWISENPQVNEEDKNRAHDRILQAYLTRFQGGTISDFFIQGVYKAIADDRPIIIDEIDAMPHEIRMSLRHILTRKEGDTIEIQQDSGKSVTIGKNFAFMMTGNLASDDPRYPELEALDAPFLSRIYKVNYDYLPQNTEGPREEFAAQSELFHIVLARVMDRNGNMEAPQDTLTKLWKLAQFARVTQDVFAGREVAEAHFLQTPGERPIHYFLKEAVCSLRAIDAILTQWQKEGYRYELDYYLWKEFISQSTVASDKAYLYQEAKDRYDFFRGNGWKQSPSYGGGGVINTFDIKAPRNSAEKREFLGPREVVEAAYGTSPERAIWPEIAKLGMKDEETNQDIETLDRLEQLSALKGFLEQELAALEDEMMEESTEDITVP